MLEQKHLKTGRVIINKYVMADEYADTVNIEFYPTIELCEEFKMFKDFALEDKTLNWELFEENEIPSLYVVRTWNGSYYSFECGIDLCADKEIWLGLERNKLPNFDAVKRELDKKFGDKWKIFTEEYFTKSEWNNRGMV